MTTTTPAPDTEASPQNLRRSLVASTHPALGGAGQGQQALTAALPTGNVQPPSSAELLGASPALERLCESYHRTYSTMLVRARRQRLGIAILVAAVSCAAVVLNGQGVLASSIASNLVLSIAGVSCAGLAVLAMLWMRDDQQLKMAQGARLLRAIQTNCTLPAERLSAFRVSSEPTTAFFDCYSLWREAHGQATRGLAAIMSGLRAGRAGA